MIDISQTLEFPLAKLYLLKQLPLTKITIAQGFRGESSRRI